MPLQSKKIVRKSFTFDQTRLAPGSSIIENHFFLCHYRALTKAKEFFFYSLRYKRQDGEVNGNSERIQSVLCEDTLRVKKISVLKI